jgi:hypothetical protein
MRLGIPAAALILVALGCGDDAAPEGTEVTPALQRDAHAIQDLIATDPAQGVLAEIDAEVEDERPIRASQMIQQAALPAARRQLDRSGDLEPGTPEGRELLRRTSDAYRRRIAALDRYQKALSRGVVEDLELVEAMRDQRLVEEELLRIHDDLAKIRPLAEEDGRRRIRTPR